MAKILWGIMGNTNGHIMRTLSLASRMPHHEFCFVGGGRVAEHMPTLGLRLHEVPVLRTMHKKGRLDLPATIAQIAARVLEIPSITEGILDLMDNFQPDLVISDREFFTPIACLRAGVPCISIDHTHVLKACHYNVPGDLRTNWLLTMANDYALFDFTRTNWIVSFFHPPVKMGCRDEFFHPVIRPELRSVQASEGDHILVYFTVPQFHGILDPLASLGKKTIVYGMPPHTPAPPHVTMKSFHPTRFLEDLASCRYVVSNGGHNVISESLYYGKPIFCFPIANHFEQYINSFHIRKLGYGDFERGHHPPAALFHQFEEKWNECKKTIQANFRDGTPDLVSRIEKEISLRQSRCLEDKLLGQKAPSE